MITATETIEATEATEAPKPVQGRIHNTAVEGLPPDTPVLGRVSTLAGYLKDVTTKASKLPAALLARETMSQAARNDAGNKLDTYGPMIDLTWADGGRVFASVSTRTLRIRYAACPYAGRATDAGHVRLPLARAHAIARSLPADTDVFLTQFGPYESSQAGTCRIEYTARKRPRSIGISCRMDLLTNPLTEASDVATVETPATIATLSGPSLASGLKLVKPFLGDSARWSGLGSVQVAFDGQTVKLLATDGVQLASVGVDTGVAYDASPEPFKALLDSGAIKLLAGLTEDWDSVELSRAPFDENDSALVFRNPRDGSEVWVREPEGRFPDVSEITGEAYATGSVIEVKGALQALKSLDPKDRDAEDVVTLRCECNPVNHAARLVVEGNTGAVRIETSSHWTADWECKVNRKRLAEVLAECGKASKTAELGYVADDKPIRLEVGGAAFFLMPIAPPKPAPEPDDSDDEPVGVIPDGETDRDPCYFDDDDDGGVILVDDPDMAPVCGGAPEGPTGKPSTWERDVARDLQDRYLALPIVQRFIAEHGENKSLWHLGPDAREVRSYILPQFRTHFECAVARFSPDDPEPGPIAGGAPEEPETIQDAPQASDGGTDTAPAPIAPGPVQAASWGPWEVIAFPPAAVCAIDTESVDAVAFPDREPDPTPPAPPQAPGMDPDRCPCCASSEIEAQRGEFDGACYTQPVECAACGARWVEVYELARVEVEDRPDPTPDPEDEIDPLVELSRAWEPAPAVLTPYRVTVRPRARGVRCLEWTRFAPSLREAWDAARAAVAAEWYGYGELVAVRACAGDPRSERAGLALAAPAGRGACWL